VDAKDARTCRIVFLNAPDDAPAKLHLFDGKKSREVELPNFNFSPVYPLPSGGLILRLLPAEVSDPAQVSTDAPSLAVPETVTDFFIIVSSDPENKIAPVKMEILDATKLGKGRLLWSNLSPNTFDGQIGSEKLELAANSTLILEPPASKNEDYAVSVSFRMPDDERPRPLVDTKWRQASDGRTVVFVIQKEGARIPRIMGLQDLRETDNR
jgi:hypothetical protein